MRAPDNSYLDFYQVTALTSGTLYVEMLSDDVDSYLWLFTDECLGTRNLDDWADFCKVLDVNGGGFDLDAYFSYTVFAGETFIIAANTLWDDEFGLYDLEVEIIPGFSSRAAKPAGASPAPQSDGGWGKVGK